MPDTCPVAPLSGFPKCGSSLKKSGFFRKTYMLNKDYKEMLQCLLEGEVRFLLVGAYALAAHGFPRATKDIDFFVWATPENSTNLMKALARFGAPLTGITAADFSLEGAIFQIGNSPRRIDIITTISGIKFEHAFANRATIFLEGLQVPVISIADLIVNKRASGRMQDLADVEKLQSTPASK